MPLSRAIFVLAVVGSECIWRSASC